MLAERNLKGLYFFTWFAFLHLSLCVCYSPRMASGMQEKQYTPSLLSFFIYNPTFGPREGEVRLIPDKHRVNSLISCFLFNSGY